jgi:hypothetical protein
MIYRIELTDPILGKSIGYFKTSLDRYDGTWFASGYIDNGTKRRDYGCSKSFEFEVQAVDYLLRAECATDVIWL